MSTSSLVKNSQVLSFFTENSLWGKRSTVFQNVIRIWKGSSLYVFLTAEEKGEIDVVPTSAVVTSLITFIDNVVEGLEKGFRNSFIGMSLLESVDSFEKCPLIMIGVVGVSAVITNTVLAGLNHLIIRGVLFVLFVILLFVETDVSTLQRSSRVLSNG